MAKAALLGPGGPPSPGSEGGEHPRFYVLPRRYLPLGAYPVGEWRVHRTHRHGPRAFTHSEFSRLRREGKPPKGGDLQLHTWEYLLAEEFWGRFWRRRRRTSGASRVLWATGPSWARRASPTSGPWANPWRSASRKGMRPSPRSCGSLGRGHPGGLPPLPLPLWGG